MTEIQLKLLTAVAERLTGKQIRVRERVPATKGLLGEIHRDLLGNLIIDISPEIQTDEKRLRVFLHELAHAKHHNYLRSDYYKAAPNSQPGPQLTASDWRQEDTAEKQAAEWLEWGRNKARELIPQIYKIAPIDAILISLLAYRS